MLFVLTLAFASSFFAESIEGNFSPVAFSVFGILSVMPLYGLHSLILGRIAFSKARPGFPTLYLCGVLFGLYEAYITKVVWTGWPPDPVKLGGVSVMAVLVVVLWWHPFMSFLLPLAFVERYGIGGRGGRSILPSRLADILDGPKGPWLAVKFGVFAGLYQFCVGATKPYAWPAGLMDALVLTLLIMALRKDRPSFLEDRLPRGSGLKVAIGLLVAYYALCLFAMNPQALPGFVPQLLVWCMYALVVALLLKSKKRDQAMATPNELVAWGTESPAEPGFEPDSSPVQPTPLTREWLPFVVSWLGVSSLQYLAPDLRNVVFVIVTLTGIVIGVMALWSSVRTVRFATTNP